MSEIPCAKPEQRCLWQFPQKAGQPFEPSNGTSGEIFMNHFCYECRKDSEARPCRIIALAMGYSVNEPEYPKEWIYGGDGWPLCTAYKGRDEGGPRKYHPKPCPLTDDMFGPNPVRIGTVDGIRDKALAGARTETAKPKERA